MKNRLERAALQLVQQLDDAGCLAPYVAEVHQLVSVAKVLDRQYRRGEVDTSVMKEYRLLAWPLREAVLGSVESIDELAEYRSKVIQLRSG